MRKILIQRYKCKLCNLVFVLKNKHHYSPEFKHKIIKQYFEGKSSYRDLARQYGINKNRINEWILEKVSNFKNPHQIAKELKPRWSGCLIADGKHIKARGKKGCWYIGVDLTGDIPNSKYGSEGENKFDWFIYFKQLKIIKYPLKYLVSDGNDDIYQSAKHHFPLVRYQTCCEHYLRKMDRIIGYQKIIREKQQIKFSKELKIRYLVKLMLFSKTYDDFLMYWRSIRYFPHKSSLMNFIRKDIKKNFVFLTIHFFEKHIPRTNNIAESFIKQIKRRLKTIEGFGSHKTANGYLHLLAIFLRFKPYTDAKNKNGKSRLQLAGVDTKDIDWLKFSQK